MKKLLNLQSGFPNIDTSWKDKTPIILPEIVRMVTNVSKNFLQIKWFFTVSNQKQMIYRKEVAYIHPEHKTYIKLQISSVTVCDLFSFIPLIHFVSTKRNPWLEKNVQSPIIYLSDTSTMFLPLELCYKSTGTLHRLIKNK